MSSSVRFLSISKGISHPYTVDNSIIAHNRDIDYLPPKELTMHAHSYYNFLYIVETESFPLQFNGTEVFFKNNQLYLQPANTLHTPTDQFTGSRTSISIRFDVTSPELMQILGEYPSVINCDEKIRKLIFEMSNFEINPLSAAELNEKLLELISAFLATKLRKTIPPCEDTASGKVFFKLIRYMYVNYDKSINLSDMAKIMHMEPTYFAKKFKSYYNMTPINYLYSVRLFRSLDMLMYTNLSIAAIAEKVGFKNVASFCTAFRRSYGLSAGEYRRAAQQRKFDITT